LYTLYQPILIAQKDLDQAPKTDSKTTQTQGDPNQEKPKENGSGGSSWISTLIFFGVMIVIFYLLIFRPQSKKAKEHQSLVSSLKKGDDIVTNSGIFGKILGVAETTATIEIAQGVKVKMLKSQIAGLQKDQEAKPSDKQK